MPFFSIVVPTYNRAGLLVRALESIFAGEFQDYEILVVDDGSTDNTLQTLEPYSTRVKVLRQENRGAGPARNLGLQNATGQYVTFLDSDDLYFPWTLAHYRRAIDQCGSPAMVAGLNHFFTDEAALANVSAAEPQVDCFPDFLAYYERRPPACFPTGCLALRHDVARSSGGFWPEHTLNEDIDLWLRLGTAAGFGLVASPPAFAQRQHPNNTSTPVASSLVGLHRMLDNERQGLYPGGPTRRAARRAVITFVTRATSVTALAQGQSREAWRIYRRTFGWHAAAGRLRYLSGFPAMAMARTIRSK